MSAFALCSWLTSGWECVEVRCMSHAIKGRSKTVVTPTQSRQHYGESSRQLIHPKFKYWEFLSMEVEISGAGVGGGKAVTHLVGWGRRPSSQGLSSINLSSWLYLKSLLTQFLFLFLEQHYPSPYHSNLESESSLTIHTSRTSPIYPPALHFHCSCFSSVVHHGSTRPSL